MPWVRQLENMQVRTISPSTSPLALEVNSANNLAVHGGGVPVRVRGVEGIVAVIVVSGLKQHEGQHPRPYLLPKRCSAGLWISS